MIQNTLKNKNASRTELNVETNYILIDIPQR